MNATAKELRFKTKTILQSVARGEEVTITMRGKPVARLITIGRQNKTVEDTNTVFGMWSDRDDLRNAGAYVRKIRKGRF